MPLPARRRNFTTRSLEGCRTCRARHKKCDEAPGACNNCVSTGRQCDGYDLSRLPVRKYALTELPQVASRLGWLTTADEMRSFSYFAQCSIPSLSTFFDSPLWHKLFLRMSHVDRAVYHAASMLGAIHEDSSQNNMRLSGENLRVPRHRFALEQASRAFLILHKRQASRDPQLREVVLLCCLLFVVCDLLLSQYDSALKHLHGGLKVLQEARGEHQRKLKENRSMTPLDRGLVESFQRLDIEFSHFGPGKPYLFTREILGEEAPDQNAPLQSVQDMYYNILPGLQMGVPFLAKCWPLSGAEMEADWDNLHCEQQEILFFYDKLKPRTTSFYHRFYSQLPYKEQRMADLLLFQCLGQTLAVKVCLFDSSVPAELVPEYAEVMATYESMIARFPERPTITMDYGVIPTLYVVASSCPDYSIRLQAINAMLLWPHCEALVNSEMSASLALERLRVDLQGKSLEHLFSSVDPTTYKELSRFLSETVKLQPVENWSTMRNFKSLQQ
ncbi:hypothetical protein BDW69DRAFT_192509 [Aspergillus filifer]